VTARRYWSHFDVVGAHGNAGTRVDEVAEVERRRGVYRLRAGREVRGERQCQGDLGGHGFASEKW
jgi:hypothetical protein